MKKFIYLIITLILSINSYSQSAKYSLNAGGNYSFFTMTSFSFELEEGYNSLYYLSSSIVFNKEISSKGKVGFFINNSFSFPINKFLAFKTGFGLSMNNMNLEVKYESYDYDYTHTYKTVYITSKKNYNLFLLKFPMQTEFRFFKERLFISGGLSMTAVMQAKNPVEDRGETIKYIVNEDFEKVFFNIDFGTEYKLIKNIYFGFRYSSSISEVSNNTDNSTYYSYRPYYNSPNYEKIHLKSFSVSISYKF